jgi:hypothetical protein
MGQIPEDAAQWDGGDWIAWHRSTPSLDDLDCVAGSHDESARLTALHVSLLRSARAYHRMTGEHLPIYRQIAHVHAALYCDLPLEGLMRDCEGTGVEVLHLAPDGSECAIEVDLSKRFATLIVVRIRDDFTCEARMIQRKGLPERATGTQKIRWQSLPHQI